MYALVYLMQMYTYSGAILYLPVDSLVMVYSSVLFASRSALPLRCVSRRLLACSIILFRSHHLVQSSMQFCGAARAYIRILVLVLADSTQ